MPLNARVHVYLSERVDLTRFHDGASLSAGGEIVEGDWVPSPDGAHFELIPRILLAPRTDYTLSLSGLEDLSSNRLEDVSITFATGTGVDLAGPKVVATVPEDGESLSNTR